MSSSLSPVSASCTIKRSFVKVTTKEFNSSSDSMPSIVLNRRDSSDINRKIVELKSRLESSPETETTYRIKLSDNSSGYGSSSSTSFSSLQAFHSIQKTPSMHSMHCFTNVSQLEPTVNVKIEKKTNKEQMIRESITNVLDQIDKRVAFLRETASELEEEKRKLYRSLNSIISSEELGSIDEVDKEEIKVATHGLLCRLNSVDVILKTMRTDSQQKALENVNKFIEKLSEYIKSDKIVAKQVCLSYLSACSSDHFNPLPVDEKFQKIIIECSLDDQKKIKKKLENLFSNLNKLELQ